MFNVLTCAEMREAEEYTFREKGVSAQDLTERAGVKIADTATEILEKLADRSVLIVCGSGNNGADGYSAARVLSKNGAHVSVCAVFKPKSEECIRQSKHCPVPVHAFSTVKGRKFGLMIDCIYGTGLQGEIPAHAAEVISYINSSRAHVLAADIPSGLNGDNGLIGKIAVCADTTVAVGALKTGLLLASGRDCCGEIKVCDIGLAYPTRQYAHVYGKELVTLFPKRKSCSDKGDYGRVSVIGGSESYSGAPLLSVGALRVGAGYLRICVPACIFDGLAGRYPEAILTKMLSDGGVLAFDKTALQEIIKQSDAIAVGMGCCTDSAIYDTVVFLLQNFKGTLVLDADALNSLARFGTDVLKTKKCKVILTPHVKEFARLCGKTVEEVVAGGVPFAKKFAADYNVILMVKSNGTIITDGKRVAVNAVGSPALAKCGSGDVLAGLVAALAVRTENKILGCACASWLLGMSASLAAADLSEYGVLATDVIKYLPQAVKMLQNGETSIQ